jgi:hypothetical protein
MGLLSDCIDFENGGNKRLGNVCNILPVDMFVPEALNIL